MALYIFGYGAHRPMRKILKALIMKLFKILMFLFGYNGLSL